MTAFNYDRWRPQLGALAGRYAEASPFPHIVLDNFLEPEAAARALAAFPKPDSTEWIQYRHFNSRKLGKSNLSEMPPDLQAVISQLNSDEFAGFVSALTGVARLIPDPMLDGGGLHQIVNGGFLKVHADFNVHTQRGDWARRVNVLVYLNQDWKDDYHGHLELWDHGMATCAQKIAPVFNRCVIFNTTRESLHGHPVPLETPEGVTRKSIALYYYTQESAVRSGSATEYHALPSDTLGRRLIVTAENKLLTVHRRLKEFLARR